MFTGLVTDVGEVVGVEQRNDVRRLRIACSYPASSIALGASIACSGPCLTVVDFGEQGERTWFDVDAAWETLDRTTVGTWALGRKINLERSLKIGDELGGHLVSGHVDGIASIVDREDLGTTSRFTIESPRPLARFIAEKGSVALDGTSLTVNTVEGSRFSVLLIPHSLEVTTWHDRQIGDQLNMEVDTMARYAARLAQTADWA
jgi:riboflavin synthase